MAPFIDKIKFTLWNLNINKLMLINFHISIITKRFFRSFDRHSDKTVTVSELLQDINNFSKTIVYFIRKSHEFSFEIVQVVTIFVANPVNFFLWMPAYDIRALQADTPSCLHDVTIFLHLAVESSFIYSLHPGYYINSHLGRKIHI